MHTGTKETTPFHIYKDEVCKAAGVRADQLHLGRLHTAYDMGEPVWIIADEMKLRAEASMPSVRPYKLPSLSNVCVRRVVVS